jgi:uncharacterized protein
MWSNLRLIIAWAAGVAALVLAACNPRVTERAAGDRPPELPAGLESNALTGRGANPFLAWHAGSAIPWQPWSPETRAAAAAAGRPIMVHIGYSTCPFSRQFLLSVLPVPAVAEFLAGHFVCALADAEEDLALNHLVLESLPRLGTVPAWPILVWLTPEGLPFRAHNFAGTNGFHPQQVLDSARRAWDEWHKDPEFIRGRATEIARQVDRATRLGEPVPSDPRRLLEEACHNLMGTYDEGYGTLSPAQNFPRPTAIGLLLELAGFFPAESFRSGQCRAAALNVLRKMAAGAIRDPLDGGFHRYSEKPNWNAPHSEKMAADQAMIAAAYLAGAEAAGDSELRAIGFATLDQLLANWRRADGLLGHATTAFDVGRPPDQAPPFLAPWFTWSAAELRELLTAEEWAVVAAVHGIRERGNMPPSLFSPNFGASSNVLGTFSPVAAVAPALGMTVDEAAARLAAAHAKMVAVRAARPGLERDQRATVAANALAVSALSRAAALPGGEAFAGPAREIFGALRDRFVAIDHKLLGSCAWAAEPAGRPAHADYAFLIQAALDLHDLAPDPGLLQLALALQQSADSQFGDETTGGYAAYLAEDWVGAGTPWMVLGDANLPSDNAVAAANLRRLAVLAGKPEFSARRARILGLAASAGSQLLTAHSLLSEIARELASGGDS